MGRVSRDLQVGLNSVSQIDGHSDMAPACLLFGSMGVCFRKETRTSAHLDARHFSSSLYTTDAFQAATLVLELRMSEPE